MPVTARKGSLDARAARARQRAHQELLYYFGRAIPDLDDNGEAIADIEQLTDSIIQAAALHALQMLATGE